MRSRFVAVVLGLALVPGPVAAQTVQTDPDGEHREGEYGGVKPGEAQTTDSGKPVKRPKAGTLSWVGFEAKDGVAHVFLQSTGELGVEQRVEGKTIIVRLTGVKRLGRNVRRPLEARFFDSPVARITVKKVRARKATKKRAAQKAGVEVRIALKDVADAREASVRTALEADGYHYVYLDVSPAAAP